MECNPPHAYVSTDPLYPFDARGIAPRFRQAAILGAVAALHQGETMRIVNDHDPLPLLQQLRVCYPDEIAIIYCERGPAGVVIDFVRH
ncbi:MAG: DUF2249 domain-containing protein [Rhodoferax sp.]|nr:DUF2249 domain-containing protein [Rhodoferax sp.]